MKLVILALEKVHSKFKASMQYTRPVSKQSRLELTDDLVQFPVPTTLISLEAPTHAYPHGYIHPYPDT